MQRIRITSRISGGGYRTPEKFSTEYVESVLSQYTHLNLRQIAHLWNVPGRYYHDIGHAWRMINAFDMRRDVVPVELHDQLLLAILFHDIVYIPGSKMNEDASGKFWKASAKSQEQGGYSPSQMQNIAAAIYLTDYSSFGPEMVDTFELASWLQFFDLLELTEPDKEQYQRNFMDVYGEFENIVNHDIELFAKYNWEFIEKILIDRHASLALQTLRPWFEEITEELLKLKAEGIFRAPYTRYQKGPEKI